MVTNLRRQHEFPTHAQLVGGLALGLASSLAAAPLCAQTPAADEPVTLTTVEVTGSHIRRAEFETVQPVLVLDRADLQRTGLSNVGEILQQLPQHVSDLNSDYNNGGNGETRVDLRNLGANRTLVLLNGRRYINTLDSAVDVGSIPLPIVDRIEVLTDGASAIYGSDAIAGVVNIITRDDYEGMEAGAYYASSEYGDGERRSADFTWGRRGERGSLALNLAFADQQPIWARDRAISAVPLFGFPANDTRAGASPTTPDGRIGFGPGGNRLPDGQRGRLTWDPGLEGYRPFDPLNDGYNFTTENYLRTPYERTSLFAQGRYDITADLSFRVDVLLHRRRSSQQLAPTPLTVFGDDPYRGPDIDPGNVYNPFDQAVTFFSFRPLNQARRFQQDVFTHYLSLGMSGAWQAGRRRFDWELSLVDAHTRQDDSISGGYDLQHLARGVGPSFLDGGGIARCGTAAAPVADCVPLDFLHGRAGFTDAMYDYLTSNGQVRETRDLRDIGFHVSGALFELPAGEVAVAAGIEHRRERGRVALDPLLTNDAFDFGGNSYDPVAGTTRINEAFVEFEVPLLAERPWAHALTLSLAARHSDYSSFGSTTNSKFGLSWRPLPELLLRATWSQGYRAPSTSELYASSFAFQTTGEFLFFDPCANDPQGAVATRCADDGVPVGSFDPQTGPNVRVGSNTGLQPERSRNRAAGVVWSPRYFSGLDIALDWWRIELDETIDEVPAELLPGLCYVDGLASACGFLRRDPATGLLLEIDARLQNYGRHRVEGWDFSLGYRWDNAWGDFRLRWDSVYLSRSDQEIPRDAPPRPLVGNHYFRDPGWRLRSLLSLDWKRGRWGATARLRYYPALDESCAGPRRAGDTSVCDRPDFQSPLFGGAPEHIIDARTYTDLQLRWEPAEGRHISLGVNNAFDRDPPIAYDSFNSYDPGYDLPGRFWYASYRHRF